MSLLAELKRRNVFKVAVAYGIVSWLLLQVSDTLVPALHLPEWFNSGVAFVLIIGFPIAMLFAWAFELTPEGIKKEKDVDRSQSMTTLTSQKLNSLIIGVLVLALAYFVIDKFILAPGRAQPGSDLAQSGPGLAQSGPDHFSQKTAGQSTNLNEKSALTPIGATPAPLEANAGATQKSIVVLPFVNMSNDPEQEFFSDGLSEELLNVLAQIKDLRVISRTSAFAFKGKDVDIPTIAAQLNVTHVLEGSVRKAGDDVRITAQLIEVATDSHLWSDAYNRKLENVFEIQEEISKAIAAELQVTLGTSGKAGKPMENMEVWQLFLRGRHLYQNRGNVQLERAIELFKQAVDLDPDFAEAWANLAAANMVNGYKKEEGYADFFRDGKLAALRAIEIDPDNGFAHAVLGLVHAGEFAWNEAMREYDLAIRLNPNETNSLLWKGIALLSLGYVDQAIATFQQAERLDPVFTNIHNWLASSYRVKGDSENMRRHAEKIQRLDPDYIFGSFINSEPDDDDLDTSEAIMRAEDIRSIGTDVLVIATFSALKDPGRKDEAVKTLLANENLAEAGDLTAYLWKIGAVDATLANFRKLRERGRVLRTANSLQIFWDAYNRSQLSNPAMPAFFEANGMVDYWRRHGDPDYCRVDGASVECGDL